MKQFTAIFLCLLFGAVSWALAQQGFRVSVLNDADEPLIGAYIYVNDKAVAATDTLGRAVIPQDTLKIGDSISVSYIFAKDQSVVVDQVMLIKGEYHFFLEETHGTLHADAVTVKAKIKRLYRKSLPIKRYPPYMFYGLYSTHFTMNITNPGDSVPSHWIAGRLEGVCTSLYFLERFRTIQYRSIVGHYFNPDPAVLDSLQRSQSSMGFVHDLPLEITTNDDTTGLEHALKYFLPRALQTNHLSFLRVHQPEPDYNELKTYPNLTINYGYLGKDKDSSRFRLTYLGHGAGTTSEVVVISDISDRINREIFETTLSFKDIINGNSYYVKSKMREARIDEFSIHGFDVWTHFAAPVELEYRITESDGTRVNITMNNINMRSILSEIMKDPPRLGYLLGILNEKNSPRLLVYHYEESESYLKEMTSRGKLHIEPKQHKKKKRERN